jgi:hypothetical protein
MSSGLDLLFINKHATSGRLTQSSGLEKSRIYSHAQQTSMRLNGNIFRVVNFEGLPVPTPRSPSPKAPTGSPRSKPRRKVASKEQAEESQHSVTPSPGKALPVVGMPFKSSTEWHLWQACKCYKQRTPVQKPDI